MVEIVQKENPVLRTVATPVPIPLIQSDKIKKIIQDMKEALKSQNDGVAIAAPQIGVPMRIFVISGKTYNILKPEKNTELKKDYPDEVYINPEVIKLSKRKKRVEEGCLSVRWLYGKVLRTEKATIKAYNEYGEEFTKGGSGLLAQIFQHEIDHLDGVLFIDKADELEEIPPEKQKHE